VYQQRRDRHDSYENTEDDLVDHGGAFTPYNGGYAVESEIPYYDEYGNRVSINHRLSSHHGDGDSVAYSTTGGTRRVMREIIV